MLWTEDWFGEAYASEWSYLAHRMRCVRLRCFDLPLANDTRFCQNASSCQGAKLGGSDTQFGGYIVPRGPTGTLNHGTPALLKKALTLVGIGAKGLDCKIVVLSRFVRCPSR